MNAERDAGHDTTPGMGTGERPTTQLTILQLFQISVFWFALNTTWGGFEVFQQKRAIQLLGDNAEIGLGIMELLAMPFAMLTMPIAGSLSDCTTTRWGRRKPYILAGAAASMVAITGLAFSAHIVTLVAFFILLQLTSNVARGPFAGLVPDIVPERQVGIASGLMGLMLTVGLVAGYLIVSTGYLLGEDFTLPMVAIGVLIFATGVGTVLWVPSGPPGKPREGRSWGRVALETFAPDILRHRSYMFLVGSRFCISMGGGFFANLNILYMEDAHGIMGGDQVTWILAGLAVTLGAAALGTIPGARISDRVGRKPVIYAATAAGAAGMLIVAAAPVGVLAVGLVGLALVGLGSGAFLSVDWALMTEIIPKASAGRYMGFSNVVEATNGPLATAIGGLVMFSVGIVAGEALGARAAMATGALLFGLGALLLMPVQEPRRGQTAVPAPAA